MKCPHCQVVFHESWTTVVAGRDAFGVRTFEYMNCPACHTIVVVLQTTGVKGSISWETIFPPRVPPREIPSEVTDPYAKFFGQASLVLVDSPMASAALSRTCLQLIIRDKAEITRKNLSNEIDALLESNQLPTHLAEDVDAVRTVGNFAAHPIKSTNTGEVVEVEDGEAEWLLDVIEGLFDFYFVMPERSKANRDALNKKLKDSGKPPLKTAPAAS